MAQLCPWTKISTNHWLVLGASFELFNVCVRVFYFLCLKCDNFASLSFIWKDDFFAKIGIFCNSISHNISQQCLSVYTTIFVRPKDKPNFCQIRHELNVAIHEMRLVEKKKTLGDWQTLLLFLVTKASQVIMKRLMTQQLYKLWKFIKTKNEWRSNKYEVLNIWEC